MAGWLVLLFAGLSLGGCEVAHMALPQDLNGGASELAVEGRALSIINKRFEFGPYRVTGVHRGWTRKSGYLVSVGATEFDSSKAKQKYEFSISESDRYGRDVKCATRADWSDVETNGFLGGRFGVELSSNMTLVCTVHQQGGNKLSKLVMAQSASSGQDVLQGVMTDGGARIDISGTLSLENSPLKMGTPTGYVFHVGGHPVGAVEVINKGTVWLDNSVTPEVRSALATASAILLLYQNVKEKS